MVLHFRLKTQPNIDIGRSFYYRCGRSYKFTGCQSNNFNCTDRRPLNSIIAGVGKSAVQHAERFSPAG
jgi:hypothetical protein